MGERNSIKIIQDGGTEPMFLYFHWGGDAVPLYAQVGLQAAKGRWFDFGYGTRLLVQNAWDAADIRPDQETGAGLSVGHPDDHDGYYHMVVVNFADQIVVIGDRRWSFEDFVAAPENQIVAAAHV